MSVVSVGTRHQGNGVCQRSNYRLLAAGQSPSGISSGIPFKTRIAPVGIIAVEKLLVLQLPVRPKILAKTQPCLKKCLLHVGFTYGLIILIADQQASRRARNLILLEVGA